MSWCVAVWNWCRIFKNAKAVRKNEIKGMTENGEKLKAGKKKNGECEKERNEQWKKNQGAEKTKTKIWSKEDGCIGLGWKGK